MPVDGWRLQSTGSMGTADAEMLSGLTHLIVLVTNGMFRIP